VLIEPGWPQDNIFLLPYQGSMSRLGGGALFNRSEVNKTPQNQAHRANHHGNGVFADSLSLAPSLVETLKTTENEAGAPGGGIKSAALIT